jgi:hypothetical protein
VGDEMLVEGLQASCRLLRLQQATAANLAQQLAAAEREGDPAGAAAGMRAELEQLSSSCVAVSDLYNQYTQPHGVSCVWHPGEGGGAVVEAAAAWLCLEQLGSSCVAGTGTTSTHSPMGECLGEEGDDNNTSGCACRRVEWAESKWG